MALFGSTKKTTSTLTSKKIRPVIVRTQNVARELQKIAKSYDISVDLLDFNIFEVQTYTRIYDGVKESEWENVSLDDLYELDEEKALLNPLFYIKQVYEIEIFSRVPELEHNKNFKLAVGANATKCKVYLSILADSQISYSSGLEQELFIMIKKRKIRAGILINIFDEMVDDVVSKIFAYIRVEEKVTYTKNETILIAEGYEPTLTINDELIFHYKKKTDLDEQTKIDYASRGFIQNVSESELIIEYIKAKNGKAGRNCRGEYISPSEPTVTHEPTFNVDNTIKVIETDNCIKYFAKDNGYISFEDNIYKIKTDVDIDEISFKKTGSILAGVTSDVSITVTEADAIKDAVGTGMVVEVTDVEIDGNVGSLAEVKAINATIGGQTHKTSIVRAETLDINVHKGTAYGNNIHITRLEHGEVIGDIVKISQALGGVIKAREIEIGVCSSYVKATASELIDIKKLQGSENIFTIDPLIKDGVQSDLDENQENIANLKNEIKEIKNNIEKYTKLIKDGMPSFVDLKKRLFHYKKNGVKMPLSFVKKYKDFQQMQENLKNIKQEFENKNDKLILLSSQTTSFQDDILNARVINRDRWVGYNEIRFKLVKPAVELLYKPADGSTAMIFGLVEVDDGEYVIEAMDE